MLLTENLSSRTLEHWLMNHLLGSYYPAIIPNYYIGYWECDVFSLNKSGYTAEYEIKQTKSDYLKDFEKQTQYRKLKKHDIVKNGKRTNRFWFVLPEGMEVDIPDHAGRMNYSVSKYSGWIRFEIVKKAPLLHKTKATEGQIMQMLMRLSDKHYRAIWDLTRNYDKYQLSL